MTTPKNAERHSSVLIFDGTEKSALSPFYLIAFAIKWELNRGQSLPQSLAKLMSNCCIELM